MGKHCDIKQLHMNICSTEWTIGIGTEYQFGSRSGLTLHFLMSMQLEHLPLCVPNIQNGYTNMIPSYVAINMSFTQMVLFTVFLFHFCFAMPPMLHVMCRIRNVSQCTMYSV